MMGKRGAFFFQGKKGQAHLFVDTSLGPADLDA
jgi:hypothetical protein